MPQPSDSLDVLSIDRGTAMNLNPGNLNLPFDPSRTGLRHLYIPLDRNPEGRDGGARRHAESPCGQDR